MNEVIAPRVGEVAGRDLRIVYGRRLASLDHVDVVVVADGGAPVVARLQLVHIASGHGTRRAMLCPTCSQPRHRLLAKEGALKCIQCHRHRTRRQLENRWADFRRRGGQQEDWLLRLMLIPSRKDCSARLRQAGRLVRVLLRADRARVAALRQQLEALMVVAAST